MSAFFTFDGSAGTFLSTPDTPDLTPVVQDMEVDVDIPAVIATEIFNKYETNQRSYGMLWTATAPGGRWSTDGSTNDKSRIGSAVMATGRHVVRVVLDIPGGGLAYFFDGAPAGTSAVTDTVFTSTAALQVGARYLGGGGPLTGDVYRAVLRNGDGGPIIADMNPTAANFPDGPVSNGSTWVSSDGRTWTVNGNGISYTDTSGPNKPDLFILREGRKQTQNQDLEIMRPRI
jgi:hypothetical protein